MDRAAAMQPRDWRLPAVACLAAGGQEEDAIPACAAVACAQIGIVLIDDMLDEDPRGEYRRLGAAQTANFAAAFLAAASNCILRAQASSTVRLAALESLNLMLTSVALGQYLDSQNPRDEDSYWRLVRMKSGLFFKTALELGAMFANAPAAVVEGVGEVGLSYGEMIQIHDDLGDCLAEPAGPDWLQGRSPLPILFAETVNHPDRERFLQLRPNAVDLEILRELQNILLRCGAVSFCVDQVMRRHERASAILGASHLPQADHLNALLESVIVPVRKILAAAANGRRTPTARRRRELL